jgi:hypothetical protein
MESTFLLTGVPDFVWGEMFVDRGFAHDTFAYFVLWVFISTAIRLLLANMALWGNIPVCKRRSFGQGTKPLEGFQARSLRPGQSIPRRSPVP